MSRYSVEGAIENGGDRELCGGFQGGGGLPLPMASEPIKPPPYPVYTAPAPINDTGIIPLEYVVLVELDPQEEKTAGGIILPTTVQDKDKLSTQEGTLIDASPHAFSYADDWPADRPPPRIGQRVMFKRYDGSIHEREINGVKRNFRLLNDKSIIAIIEGKGG